MSDLQQALNRLARNMTITQVALDTQPKAALFALNIEALKSSVDDVAVLLPYVPADTTCSVAERAMGPATAALLADALASESPTPDTVPDHWEE